MVGCAAIALDLYLSPDHGARIPRAAIVWHGAGAPPAGKPPSEAAQQATAFNSNPTNNR